MGSCQFRFLLLALAPAIILAAPDPTYNPLFPFRPNNITGLGALYTWVGSYYNATTQIELAPLIGNTVNEPICANLRGKTLTAEFDSFLAVTERGPYNTGQNPVNTLLTLWKPGVNSSDLPSDAMSIWISPSLEWYLESAPWVLQTSETTTTNDLGEKPPLPDIFNLTLAPTTRAPYNLTGDIIGAGTAVSNFQLDLATCNPSVETDQYLVSLIYGPSLDIQGWNWTYPKANLQFDRATANFSVDGYFTAAPFLRAKTGSDPRNPTLSSSGVHGKIKITFRGIIDSYHSDILVNNTATPIWLRTVGFQNNSLNIDYSSASPGFLRPLSWSVAFVTSLLAITALSI